MEKRNKNILIIVYLAIVTFVWVKARRENAKMKRREGYQNVPTLASVIKANKDEPVIKSFGTILRDHPQVEALANQLLTISAPYTLMRPLPKEFKGQEVWKDYMVPVTNQGKCGSCWSHSTSAMLSDRIALHTFGQIRVQLSPSQMPICEVHWTTNVANEFKNTAFVQQSNEAVHLAEACNGNSMYHALYYLYTTGISPMTCMPMASLPGYPVKYDMSEASKPGDVPKCIDIEGLDRDKCADGKTAMRHFCASSIYNIDPSEKAIMAEIYRWGPITAGYKVYDNFLNSFDGKSIYMGPEKDSTVVGGHAISIVGWGEDTVGVAPNTTIVPYWWIRNSWGPKYGYDGFFKMKRQIPEIDLEKNAVGLIPELPDHEMLEEHPSIGAQDPTQLKVHQYFADQIDPATRYFKFTIEKIKKGELQGDLTPILTHALPSDKLFFASDVGTGNEKPFDPDRGKHKGVVDKDQKLYPYTPMDVWKIDLIFLIVAFGGSGAIYKYL